MRLSRNDFATVAAAVVTVTQRLHVTGCLYIGNVPHVKSVFLSCLLFGEAGRERRHSHAIGTLTHTSWMML